MPVPVGRARASNDAATAWRRDRPAASRVVLRGSGDAWARSAFEGAAPTALQVRRSGQRMMRPRPA